MMARAKVAELDPLPGEAPPGPWLEAMAGEWVERWLAHGGWLIADANCDKVSLGMRLNSSVWRVKKRELHVDNLWHDGWKVGRWRELGEMAGYVPGLRVAIIHHVALNGTPDPSGSTCMTRTSAEMGVV